MKNDFIRDFMGTDNTPNSNEQALVEDGIDTSEGRFKVTYPLKMATLGLTESIIPTLKAKPPEFWRVIAELSSASIKIDSVNVGLRYEGPVSQAVDTDIV